MDGCLNVKLKPPNRTTRKHIYKVSQKPLNPHPLNSKKLKPSTGRFPQTRHPKHATLNSVLI